MKTRFNDTIEQKELCDAVNQGIESGEIHLPLNMIYVLEFNNLCIEDAQGDEMRNSFSGSFILNDIPLEDSPFFLNVKWDNAGQPIDLRTEIYVNEENIVVNTTNHPVSTCAIFLKDLLGNVIASFEM